MHLTTGPARPAKCRTWASHLWHDLAGLLCVDTASDGREIGPSGFPIQISAELVMRRAGMPLELFAT